MKYLDNQHRILKYLCKFRYGVTKAHLKCLSNIGDDVKALKTAGKIAYKDAVVDMAKLKSLFVERKTMTAEEYETALKGLITDGYLTKQYVVTNTGKQKNKKVFKAYYNSDEYINSLKYNADGTEVEGFDVNEAKKNLLFND